MGIYNQGTKNWRDWVSYWINKTITIQNNIDNPQWLIYKAFLTQSGTDQPTVRILNQNESDYIDINFTLDTNIISTETFDGSLSITNLGAFTLDTLTIPVIEGGYSNTYLEVKVKQRGTPPNLISAETNTTGDKVILTFDKEISGYLLDPENTAFTIFVNEAQFDFFMDELVILSNTIDINKVIASTDVVKVSFTWKIESLDYGLLQSFENFPVVNNVVAV